MSGSPSNGHPDRGCFFFAVVSLLFLLLFAPEGRWVIAAGGATLLFSVAQPVGTNIKIISAPEGAAETFESFKSFK